MFGETKNKNVINFKTENYETKNSRKDMLKSVCGKTSIRKKTIENKKSIWYKNLDSLL